MRWRGGLALLVALAVHRSAEAQVVRDTTARRDTAALRADTVRSDTIQAPIARNESPPLLEIGEGYRWDRQMLFASGAVNVLGLLERIPGLTWFRSSWIASPHSGAYLGSAARVRVYLDGLEFVSLDPRTESLLDLTEVPLWALEEVAVERGADELRVYLRSWHVDRTTTSTRTDVVTGDVDTNLYRGYFGKRFFNGGALQLAGQQFGTTGNEFTGGGDQLSLLGRVGWARGPWSLDAFAVRSRRTRDLQNQRLGDGSIPALRAVRLDSYVRAGYGNVDDGPWAQLIAASQSFDEESAPIAGSDEADTSRTHTQYLAAGGFTRGALRLSATARVHSGDIRREADVSARATFERGILGVSLYAERGGDSLTSSEEAQLRLTPLPWLALTGAGSRRHGGTPFGDEEVMTTRGEVGVRLWDLWLGGGGIRRDAVTVPPLRVYNPSFEPARDDGATGGYLFARGRVWRAIHADVYALQWDEAGPYRPRTQTRSELFVRTNWLGRFPSGNFGFLASFVHEYRSFTIFPTLAAGDPPEPAFDATSFSHTITTRLEIRIQDAVIFWQQRLVPRPSAFDYVPGFVPPRRLTLYGVRWQFWN
ncbi:MAG TPA: hypothetical protein VJ803_12810 [Gemmatimonadaceae bacterium]|nr:hypothetical protein [Gemmatimonadaceae bacterium]